ncbi:MAG: nuclear transport factor 2 family protein [Alphaproteobacteria bacterium]|jgi:ketosteroid isomerase-like protein
MSDDRMAVLAANQAFYNAFAAGDMDAMNAAWAEQAPVACAHPGAPLLVGRVTVLESWASILNAGARPEVLCFKPHVHLLERAAYVTCYERLGGERGATLLATNIFAKEGEAWRMVHHHASPTPVTPPRRTKNAPDRILH